MRRWPWAAAVAVVGVSIAQLRTKRPLPYGGKPCTAQGCRPSFSSWDRQVRHVLALLLPARTLPCTAAGSNSIFDHAYDASRMSVDKSQFPSFKGGSRRGRAGLRATHRCRGASRGTYGVPILVIAGPAERAPPSTTTTRERRVPLPFDPW